MTQPPSRRTLLQARALVAAGGGTGVATGRAAAATGGTAEAAWTVSMVGRNAATEHLEPGLYRKAGLSGDLLPSLTPVADHPLRFSLAGTEFAPFYEGTEDPAHACFSRSEPTMVFGGLDSGGADPAGPDGGELLDEVWAGAPFRDKAALVARVRSVVDTWVAAGLLSGAHGDRVPATAREASYAR